MKKTTTAALLLLSLTTMQAQAEDSWLDTIKGMLGMAESSEPAEAEAETSALSSLVSLPQADGLISSLTSNLGVNTEQATGGMAALFSYAKDNVSVEDFSALSEQIPGLDGLMSAVPSVSEVSSGGLGGLLDKASEYNESLQAINTLNKQFEALGLDSEMILSFIQQAKSYLDTEEGQKAKDMLTSALSGIQL